MLGKTQKTASKSVNKYRRYAYINKHRSTPSGAGFRSVTNKQTNKKLLFFRSPVAVRLSISTKLCMQIKDSVQFLPQTIIFGSDP